MTYEINRVEYWATKTTTDLLEGTNLYYSIARLNADLATKTIDDLNQGITKKYLNAFSIADTTEINHTHSTLSPILFSAINTGSIVLSKLNSSSYSSNNTASTLVQRDTSGNFATNKIVVTGGNNASGVSYSAMFGSASSTHQDK